MEVESYSAMSDRVWTEHLESGYDPDFRLGWNGEVEELKYWEYLKDPVWRERMENTNALKVVLGQTVLMAEADWLDGDGELSQQWKEFFRYYEKETKEMGLAYFAPSGPGAVAFLNDDASDLRILRAPNRVGKTVTAVVDAILDLIPCDEEWPIFKQHGVNWRRWEGPKHLGVSSYTLQLLQMVIWPELRKWITDEELGPFAASFVGGDGRGRKRTDINWNNRPYLPLKCGSSVSFHTYGQDQESYESFAADRFVFDEQPPEETVFGPVITRLRTRRGRAAISATPHAVHGRPDTGAGGVMYKLDTGELTYGCTIKGYRMQVPDVPDWIYPEESKAKEYRARIIEPLRDNNMRAYREGRSRFFGDYHMTSGLVYDEWLPAIHLIPPFELTADMTLYRAVDYGFVNPAACLWFAVDVDRNIYVYREYYQRQRTAIQVAMDVVTLSGNVLDEQDEYEDNATGMTFKRYVERPVKERIQKTVLDSRSFTQREMGREISWLFNVGGLRCQPASGKFTKDSLGYVRELLTIDKDRVHPVTGDKGAPRLFVFENCVNFQREILNYVYQPRKGRVDIKNLDEEPRKLNDHLMDCLRYGAQIPLRYLGDFRSVEGKKVPVGTGEGGGRKRKRDRITGY